MSMCADSGPITLACAPVSRMRIIVPLALSTSRPSAARAPRRTGFPRSRRALRTLAGLPGSVSRTVAVLVLKHVSKPSVPLNR